MSESDEHKMYSSWEQLSHNFGLQLCVDENVDRQGLDTEMSEYDFYDFFEWQQLPRNSLKYLLEHSGQIKTRAIAEELTHHKEALTEALSLEHSSNSLSLEQFDTATYHPIPVVEDEKLDFLKVHMDALMKIGVPLYHLTLKRHDVHVRKESLGLEHKRELRRIRTRHPSEAVENEVTKIMEGLEKRKMASNDEEEEVDLEKELT